MPDISVSQQPTGAPTTGARILTEKPVQTVNSNLEVITCFGCHQPVVPQYYFCPNCGKKLKEPPPSTSIERQIQVYLISIFLPPIGFFYTYKYLKVADSKSQMVGWIAAVLTIISLVVTLYLTKVTMDKFNVLLDQQMQQIQGTY